MLKIEMTFLRSRIQILILILILAMILIQFEMHQLCPITEHSFSVGSLQVCLPDMTIVHFRLDDTAEFPLSAWHFVIHKDDEIIDIEVA